MKFIKCLWMAGLISLKSFATDYDVRDFGAVGDGNRVNTEAIQRAIDECAKLGGRVLISQGNYVTGTLYLKSNTSLVIERNARLTGSTDLVDYPHNKVDFRFWGDTWVSQALIIAHNVENISIEGEGTIDGRGDAFPMTTRKKPDKYRDRPYLLWVANCNQVTVKGIELRSSAMWMQSYIRCDNLRIENIRIFNHANNNNDMIDIDGCRDVVITGVVGDADDDGITLKSTRDRISENIVISNCILSSHCNALKFGTETTAGFRNVTITNCIIRKSAVKEVISGTPEGICGLALEIVDGGMMENININNLVIDGQRVPLFVRLGNRARKHYAEAPEPPVGSMKDIILSNITAVASSPIGCSVTGIPSGRIQGLTLANSRFICVGGEDATLIHKEVEELENEYPESSMFGTLPAYGLYVRHVENFNLYGTHFELTAPDGRATIVCDDVVNGFIRDITLSGSEGGEKVMVKNSENVQY
ncbi:MAG: glycosyl hydrolase family 28 protein [Bacteroides sp.]|nr:glycosyl hydrolase family 28 protein [Bacteroides sp.]